MHTTEKKSNRLENCKWTVLLTACREAFWFWFCCWNKLFNDYLIIWFLLYLENSSFCCKLLIKKKFTCLFNSKIISVFINIRLMWYRDLVCLGDPPVWWLPFLHCSSTAHVPCPAGVFCPLECGKGSALTIIFESPSHLSPFFSRNHPWLLWDVCEPLLPPTVTIFPGCSSDLYWSSHPAKHTSVYMHHTDIWCCLSGLSDLAAYVYWETEVNLGHVFSLLPPPLYKD